MNKVFIYCFTLLIFVSCNKNNNPDNPASETPTEKQLISDIDKRAREIFTNYNFQGDFLLAVVDEDGLVSSTALNRQIIEGKQTGLNNDSPIYIASHTKAFTGTLLNILEEKDILNLDISLSESLPELKLKADIKTDKITINNLLTHTHGIFSTIVT